jgi:hypothetical protein
MLSYSVSYSMTKGHDFRWVVMASDLVGRTGFEPVTSSVSVLGGHLAGSQDFAMSGSGSGLRRVVVRRRCCHSCCHRWSGRRWVMSTTTHVFAVSGVPARLADPAKDSMSVAGVSRRLPNPDGLVSNPLTAARSGRRWAVPHGAVPDG